MTASEGAGHELGPYTEVADTLIFAAVQLAAQAAGDLIGQYRPLMSEECFGLSERLRLASWRFASATYCLSEWLEPDDEAPDVDENPGPKPGRRATWAWDQDTPTGDGSWTRGGS